MSKIEIYDTTLRDGAQSEDISLSLDDKCSIIVKLDQLGLDYIEAGWPGANPKDDRLFGKIKSLAITHSKIMAFGSTCKPGKHPENDRMIKHLINAKPDGVTIFGKSWDTHVKGDGGIGCSLDENLRMIRDTVAYLKGFFSSVFFDAEHFFDGFKVNREYALSTLKAAIAGGVDRIILCDTNGGDTSLGGTWHHWLPEGRARTHRWASIATMTAILLLQIRSAPCRQALTTSTAR